MTDDRSDMPWADLAIQLKWSPSASAATAQRAAATLRERDIPGETVSATDVLDVLLHDNTELRIAAIWALGAMMEQAPSEPLLAVLSDPSPKVRSAAVIALSTSGWQAPTGLMTRLLADPEPSVRCAVIRTMSRRLSEDELLSALDDDAAEVFNAAARTVRDHATERFIGKLLSLVESPSSERRRSVVGALGSLGELAPLEALLTRLNDADDAVRHEAIRALGRQSERMPSTSLRPFLADPSSYLRLEAAKALGKYGDPDALAIILTELRIGSEYRAENVLSFLSSGYDANETTCLWSQTLPIEVLLDLLSDDWRPGGIMAARFIACRNEVPFERLLAHVTSDNPTARYTALYAIAHLSTSTVGHVPMDVLLSCLDDVDISVRRTAALALEPFGDRVPVERLIPHIEREDATVAAVAARLGHDEGIRGLVRALGSRLSQREALAVLKTLGRRAPANALMATLGSSEGFADAAEALYATHPEVLMAQAPRFVNVLLGSDSDTAPLEPLRQSACVRALARLASPDEAFITYLTRLLSWNYWETRYWAVMALAKMPGSLPEPTLTQLGRLREDRESSDVRLMATRFLGRTQN